LTIPYSTSEFDTSEGIPLEDFLSIYLIDSSTSSLQGLDSSAVDRTNHVVTGSLPHFSVWMLKNAARLCPPRTAQNDCPNSYAPMTFPTTLPLVMVHGVILGFSPMGGGSTWGNLPLLLGQVDSSGGGRIDAWRFDYDSQRKPFE